MLPSKQLPPAGNGSSSVIIVRAFYLALLGLSSIPLQDTSVHSDQLSICFTSICDGSPRTRGRIIAATSLTVYALQSPVVQWDLDIPMPYGLGFVDFSRFILRLISNHMG